MPEPTENSVDIQVVDRCAQVLRMFSHDCRTVRVADVAAELGVGRTTAHRYLASLAGVGLLERDEDRGYRLGPLLAQVGSLALDGLDVVDIADPHLRDLAETAAETSVLSVWGGRGPVIVRTQEPEHRVLNLSIRVGRTLDLHAAQSAIFLAYRPPDDRIEALVDQLGEPHTSRIRKRIEQVRLTGIAISDTVNQGTRAVAAPIFDREHRLVAALAIIGTVHTLPTDLDSGKIRALRNTAAQLSAVLGYRVNQARKRTGVQIGP